MTIIERVLAIGAHPDDIEISVGGTLMLHKERGDEVLGVVVTIPQENEIREKEVEVAAKIMGLKVDRLNLESQGIQFNRNLVGIIDKIIKDFNPTIIYTHWINDSHQDHHHLAQATIAAARHNKCSVFMYEQTIPGGVGASAFRPQLYVDITKVIDRKIDSVKAHKSQILKNFEWWMNGLKGRCAYHGFQIGVNYAEVFEIVKLINVL